MGGLTTSLFYYDIRRKNTRQYSHGGIRGRVRPRHIRNYILSTYCNINGGKKFTTKEGTETYPIPIGTYGNFSFVQAPPKTKKTFFISLLASVYLADSNKFGGDIKGHRGNKCLLHFDTEQGKWHCQKVFRRVLDMNNREKDDNYFTFTLRTVGYKSRLEFIEYWLREKVDDGKAGLVIIDGVADLVSDVNNLEESNNVVQKLMQLTAIYNCHIVTIIHSNYGTTKPTGHLGSLLEKKQKHK